MKVSGIRVLGLEFKSLFIQYQVSISIAHEVTFETAVLITRYFTLITRHSYIIFKEGANERYY